jgi:hypothetical protein
MLLARSYNLFPGLNNMSGLEMLMTDAAILNHVIEEYKAHEDAMKESEMKRKLPGVTRMVSVEERSQQLAAMKKRS